MKLKTGKKSGLVYFDINNIRSWNPCYNPNRYLEENKRYNILDILQHDKISHADKLWVALRTDLVSEKCMRLFAVWSARQVLKPDADQRLFNALEVAERFVQNLATNAELSAAWNAAWSAASAARSAASAARSAAESAAWSAASAARSAAESAAWSAASAAESAAWSAASAARSAAWSAAWSAEQKKQLDKLIEMIKIEGLERVNKRKKSCE